MNVERLIVDLRAWVPHMADERRHCSTCGLRWPCDYQEMVELMEGAAAVIEDLYNEPVCW